MAPTSACRRRRTQPMSAIAVTVAPPPKEPTSNPTWRSRPSKTSFASSGVRVLTGSVDVETAITETRSASHTGRDRIRRTVSSSFGRGPVARS
jgi:hypothetical protein